MSQTFSGKPKILSLAASEKEANVAISAGQKVLQSVGFNDWLEQFPDPQAIGRSSALVSMVKQALQMADVPVGSLDAIALTHGPGRFTGLRVAVVTARMLCYAWDLPVVAINSLYVSAAKLQRERSLGPGEKIWAITDAQRRQVFASQFETQPDGNLKSIVDQGLFDREEILERLEPRQHVTGSGAFAFGKQIESKTQIALPDVEIATCDAIGVAAVAQARVEVGDFDDPMKVDPIYFRPSAAEEVRLAKQG